MTFPNKSTPELVLPEGFRFSQSSLQDYVDCRRRFQLRYLQNLAWPAVQSEPALENERFMLRGSFFHHLTQQYFLGVPPERLQATIADPDLAVWWENFLAFARQEKLDQRLAARPSGLYAEKGFSAPLGMYRLVAQYDLLLSDSPGHFIIYDWKTSRKRPKRKWLAERVQTRLYPYLFANAGASLNKALPVEPQSVELRYWFAAFPEKPERFAYSQAGYEQDRAYLTRLVDEISHLQADEFPLTEHIERCAYCVYRSLCNRGERAGAFGAASDIDEESDSSGAVSIDFEQIAEIVYE